MLLKYDNNVMKGLGILRTRRADQIWGCLSWRVRQKWNKLLVYLLCDFNPLLLVSWLVHILIKFKCFPRWCYTDEASTEWEYCSPPGEVFQYFPLIKVRSLNVDIITGAGHCLYSEWPRLYRRVCNSGWKLLVISFLLPLLVGNVRSTTFT